MRGTSAEETAQAGTPTDTPHPDTTTNELTAFPPVAIAYFLSFDGDEIDFTAQADDTTPPCTKVDGIDGTYVITQDVITTSKCRTSMVPDC